MLFYAIATYMFKHVLSSHFHWGSRAAALNLYVITSVIFVNKFHKITTFIWLIVSFLAWPGLVPGVMSPV